MSRPLLAFLVPLIMLLHSSTGMSHPVLHQPDRPDGPVGPPSFALNSHLATRYPDPTSMDIAAANVAVLGVEWVREDIHWHRVQPAPDVWDWTFPDAALLALQRHDIQVLGVLGPSVGWATPYRGDEAHNVSFYPPDQDAFITYVRAVVTRYQHYINHWEIWNEPDNPLFWQPEPDSAAYARLLMRASVAIKEIDPDAQVLVGGFNPFDTTFIREVAELGAWDSFDILAIHPYVDPYSPEEGNITASLDKMHVMTYRYGEKPIWVTEIGWSSGPGDRDRVGLTDEDEQAHFLARSMLLLWLSGVERTFWYSLKDDPHNPYGLIEFGRGRTDFRRSLRKPAFYAFRTLNSQLIDTTFVERRDLFDSITLSSFASVSPWLRTSQPNGSLDVSDQGIARVQYNFSTAGNDYLAFEHAQSIPLRGNPYAIGIWIYGDGTDHALRAWIRDAEGELLQYTLGVVGNPGWTFVSAPIDVPVEPGNRLAGSGNGRLDFPASLTALVVDDAYDADIGAGTIYLDNLTAIRGREIYDIRLARGGTALDILWSPPGMRATLNTSDQEGRVITLSGTSRRVRSFGGRFSLYTDAEPLFLWHTR